MSFSPLDGSVIMKPLWPGTDPTSHGAGCLAMVQGMGLPTSDERSGCVMLSALGVYVAGNLYTDIDDVETEEGWKLYDPDPGDVDYELLAPFHWRTVNVNSGSLYFSNYEYYPYISRQRIVHCDLVVTLEVKIVIPSGGEVTAARVRWYTFVPGDTPVLVDEATVGGSAGTYEDSVEIEVPYGDPWGLDYDLIAATKGVVADFNVAGMPLSTCGDPEDESPSIL